MLNTFLYKLPRPLEYVLRRDALKVRLQIEIQLTLIDHLQTGQLVVLFQTLC